jgi:predicted Zn-dependent peptidase
MSTKDVPGGVAMAPRPVVAPPPAWRFPAVDEAVLSNGVKLLTVHLPGQYVASARLVLMAPVQAEPAGRYGIGTLVSRTLDEGTAVRSGEEFAAATERQGAHYGAWLFDGSVQVGVDVATGRLAPALDLAAEAVTSPVFPEAEISRHVALRLGEIAQEAADPGTLAGEVFAAHVFAEGARLGIPLGGTAETVRGLRRDAAVDYYARTYAPDRATLVIAGDLSDLDVESIADKAFGSWRAEAPPAQLPTAPPPGRPASLVVVNRPGSVQTELVIGCPGPDRTDPEWAAHLVAARIIGGTLTSRLDRVLREQKGYTYGIRSAFSALARGGFFSTHGSVRTEVTGAALADALAILAEAHNGFTENELTDAVGYLTRMAPLRYQTATDVASQVAANIGNGVAADFVDRHQAALAAVTADAARDAYAATVRQDRLTVVAVGDADAISAQLAEHDLSAYGLGDVIRAG